MQVESQNRTLSLTLMSFQRRSVVLQHDWLLTAEHYYAHLYRRTAAANSWFDHHRCLPAWSWDASNDELSVRLCISACGNNRR